tara:strand:- start:1064 stop:1711 length:648 start_codon:yes stop_codon:yes gene_type:complete
MIEYLSHDGTDNSIANTARVSFAGEDWLNLPEGYTPEQRNKLIKYLATHKHMSPFRHNSISIRCEMPIFIVRQLGKHQAGLSWNEVSRRYCTDDVTFHVPEEWRAAPDGSIKQGSAGIHTHSEFYSNAYAKLLRHAISLYEDMIMDKVAPEMARMVLPQSMNTKWVWTGNLLAMAHIYRERSASGAQLECQWFAKKLNEVLRPLFPVAWSALVDG